MGYFGTFKLDFDLKASFAKSVSLPIRAALKPRKTPKRSSKPRVLIIVIKA